MYIKIWNLMTETQKARWIDSNKDKWLKKIKVGA